MQKQNNDTLDTGDILSNGVKSYIFVWIMIDDLNQGSGTCDQRF